MTPYSSMFMTILRSSWSAGKDLGDFLAWPGVLGGIQLRWLYPSAAMAL